MNRQVDDVLDALAHHRRGPVDAERPDPSFAGRLRAALGHLPADRSFSPAPTRRPARRRTVAVQWSRRAGWSRLTATAATAGLLALTVTVLDGVRDAADRGSDVAIPTAEPTTGPTAGGSTPAPTTDPAGRPVHLARVVPSSGTGYVLLPASDAIRLDCREPGGIARVTYALPVRRSVLAVTLSARGRSAAVEVSVGTGQERRSFPVIAGRPTEPVVYRADGPADRLSLAVRCPGGATTVTLTGPTLTS